MGGKKMELENVIESGSEERCKHILCLIGRLLRGTGKIEV